MTPFTRPVAGVVFDMDGLLLDTERVNFDALFRAAVAVNCLMTDDFARSMIGMPGKECDALMAEYYGPGFSISAFNAAFESAVETELQHEIPLRPGARELVLYLAAEGIPLALASSSRRPTVERYLTRVGLIERFDAVVSREDVEKPKPAPDPFLTAARRLGVDPADCLALEDSHHGVAAAHAAGMMTIMVPDLLPATDAICAKCVAVLPDLHAVRALLREARVNSCA